MMRSGLSFEISFLIPVLLIIGCATTVTQKRVLQLPSSASNKAWSRAHSYLAQYGGDSFYVLTDYAIATEDSEDGKTIMILREEYDGHTKIIVIAEKTDTGDSYYIKSELKQDVLNARSYIQRGETIEFDKGKEKPDRDRMKRGGGRGGKGGMGSMGGKGGGMRGF